MQAWLCKALSPKASTSRSGQPTACWCPGRRAVRCVCVRVWLPWRSKGLGAPWQHLLLAWAPFVLTTPRPAPTPPRRAAALWGSQAAPPTPYDPASVKSVVRWGTVNGSYTEESVGSDATTYTYRYPLSEWKQEDTWQDMRRGAGHACGTPALPAHGSRARCRPCPAHPTRPDGRRGERGVQQPHPAPRAAQGPEAWNHVLLHRG